MRDPLVGPETSRWRRGAELLRHGTRLRRATASVGTVVLNYDRPTDTAEAVSSLLRSSHLDHHVVVVDNAADEAAQDALLGMLPSTVSYLPTGENLGYAGGNNRGIAFLLDAGVQYVCLVNPDARVEVCTVAGLVLAAEKHRDAGFVGPRLLHGGSSPTTVQSDGGRLDWSRGGATTHVNGDSRLSELRGGRFEVDFVTGACVLLRRSMLEDVGLIPEEYFLYYEETEHALLAARRGWVSLVDRDVRAKHFRRSTAAFPTRAYLYYMTRNRALFAARHGPDANSAACGLEDLDETFVEPWARRVAERVPALVEAFDVVAELAKEHGREGRTGRYERLVDHAVDGIPGWET
ncbi:glycosyltransferase [Isoptericola jiangsuensis]|uniref:glycosyltransferase n=1 Tax=Isoptericola jiangsuensis TaxID=548579 RepID=UPI003AB0A0F3